MAPWPAIRAAGGVVGGLMGGSSEWAAHRWRPRCCRCSGSRPWSPSPCHWSRTIPGAATAAVPGVRSGERPPRGRRVVPCSVPFPPRSSGHCSHASSAAQRSSSRPGLVLLIIGVRVLLPIEDAAREAGTRRRQNRPLLVASASRLGRFTGVAGCYRHVQQDRRLVRRHACPGIHHRHDRAVDASSVTRRRLVRRPIGIRSVAGRGIYARAGRRATKGCSRTNRRISASLRRSPQPRMALASRTR